MCRIAATVLTVPVDLVWRGSAPLVTLGEISPDRLDTPFWDDAIERSARRTRLVPLDAIPLSGAPLGLAGAIHHMTRCGSTALLRQFHALDGVFGVSEPFVFLKLLGNTSANPAQTAPRVRRLASLFRDGLAPIADRLVIKWPTLLCRSAEILGHALPEVPMVFVHRNPAEVLASIEQCPLGKVEKLGAELLAGPGETPMTGSPPFGIEAIARMLAAGCRWVAKTGAVRRLDYAELPEAGWRDVAPYFGFALSGRELAAMQAESARDAKSGTRTFVPDSARKHARASPEAQRLARDLMLPALAEVTQALSPVGRAGA